MPSIRPSTAPFPPPETEAEIMLAAPATIPVAGIPDSLHSKAAAGNRPRRFPAAVFSGNIFSVRY